MTEHNGNSNSKQKIIQTWAVVLIMITSAVLSLGYSMNHYSDGGCDGGLCGLLLLFHAAPLALAWIFSLLAFALVKVSRMVSMALLALGGIVNAGLLVMDYGRHLEELDVPVVILFAAQVYIFFQWQSSSGKFEERNSNQKTN